MTAGFYSKDLILLEAWSSALGGPWLWLAGLVGALLTSLYTFRMVFLVFFGDLQRRPTGRSGWRLHLPLVVLAVLSIIGGFVELPSTLGDKPHFSTFMQSVLPAVVNLPARATQMARLQIVDRDRVAGRHLHRLGAVPAPSAIARRSHAIAGAPRTAPVLVRRLGLRPALRRGLRAAVRLVCDASTSATSSIASTTGWPGARERPGVRCSETETGRVRWYAAGIAVGALVITAIVIFS